MTGNQDLFQKLMNQGHSEAWDQRWDRAAAFYLKALEEIPDEPKALTSLGMALLEMQEFETALRYYVRACQVAPNDPLPFEKAGQIYERMGRLVEATQMALQAGDLYVKSQDVNKAIENWTRVVRFNPSNNAAHSRLAVTLERLGRRRESVAEYLNVASLFQHAGNQDKALQTVQYAMTIMPESSEARQALTMVKTGQPLPMPARAKGGTGPVLMAQVRQMDTGKEEEESETSKLDPILEGRQNALVVLAGLLFDQSDDSAESSVGRRDLSDITAGKSDGSSAKSVERSKIFNHLGQAVDAQTHGDETMAARELEKAIAAGLSHPAAYFDLGLLRSQTDTVENSLRNLSISVKSPDFSMASHLLIAQILHKNSRFTEAAVEYMEALRLADAACLPDDQADEINQLYEPLIEAQRQPTDQAALKVVCENLAAQLLEANWRERISNARQQLMEQSDDPTQLQPVAEIFVQLQSSEVVEAMGIIRNLVHSGEFRAAMEEAFYALKFAPTYLPLHTQIGDLLVKEQLIPEALAKYRTVIRVYNARGDTLQSIKLLRRAVQIAPMDAEMHQALIDLLTANGMTEQAIQSQMDLADTYYHVADLLKARKTYMNALHLAQQVTGDVKWNVEILNRMADIDMQRLDFRQALRVLEQIRTLTPDDEKTRAGIIDLNFRMNQPGPALAEMDSFVTYLESIHQVDKAIKFLQGMVQEMPDRYEIRKRLAEMLQQANRITEAIAEYDIAGEICLNAGNTGTSISIIQAIINLNPPNVQDYRNLLQQISKGA